MNEFYEVMDQILGNGRCCPDCGEKMWVCYGDGHVWDKCFDCPEKFSLDLAGYITDYPVPTEEPPETFEVREWSSGEHLKYRKEHEKAYRKSRPNFIKYGF